MAAHGTHSGSKLLLRANRARAADSGITPFDLWQLADRESAGVAAARREMYRHALIHAGMLVETKTGEPYRTCPECFESLAG